MQRCHVNKLGRGGGGGGGGNWTKNHAGSPRLASPLLFSPRESSRLTNKAAPVFWDMIELIMTRKMDLNALWMVNRHGTEKPFYAWHFQLVAYGKTKSVKALCLRPFWGLRNKRSSVLIIELSYCRLSLGFLCFNWWPDETKVSGRTRSKISNITCLRQSCRRFPHVL